MWRRLPQTVIESINNPGIGPALRSVPASRRTGPFSVATTMNARRPVSGPATRPSTRSSRGRSLRSCRQRPNFDSGQLIDPTPPREMAQTPCNLPERPNQGNPLGGSGLHPPIWGFLRQPAARRLLRFIHLPMKISPIRSRPAPWKRWKLRASVWLPHPSRTCGRDSCECRKPALIVPFGQITRLLQRVPRAIQVPLTRAGLRCPRPGETAGVGAEHEAVCPEPIDHGRIPLPLLG